MGTSGKTAPSFIASIAVVALLIAGYLAWNLLRPSGVARSEQVVREFGRDAASEIGPLRRALREQVERYTADPSTAAEVRAAIDELAAEAKANIEQLAGAAREEIEMMEGIGLRTQENRLNRVRDRKADAESKIGALVDEARAKLPEERP
jgi:hypothetical protein